MSEPMSAGEIEDVLSSIRRLVSEDLRPAAHASHPVAARDKLILTPALRVVEGGFPDDDQPVQAGDGGEDAAGLDAPTSALQAVLDDITRPAGMFDAPFAAAFDPVESAAVDAPAAPPPLSPPPSIEAVVAAVGAAVTDQRARDEGDEAAEIETDWVPDGWSELPVADPGQAGHHAAAEAPEAKPTAPPEAEPTDQDERTEPDAAAWGGFVSARDPGAPAASAAVPAPDDAAAKRRDDQAEAEAVAEITASEDFETEAIAAERDPAPAAFAGVFDPGDTALDEEILRDLVRDIIREELQGGLGARITRNVRKLVRAEINLALAGRDFD